MRLPWVPYCKIVVTNDLPASVQDGVLWIVNATTNGWTIKIRPDWTENLGLLAHERAHVQLNYLNALTLGLLRRFMGARRWRLWQESRAYAIQTKYPNRDGGSLSLQSAALLLMAPRYALELTLEEATAAVAAHL